MRVTTLLAVTAVLLFTAPFANAQTSDVTSGYGVRATASTIQSCPSFCTGDLEFESSGGEFVLSAGTSASRFGTARSEGFFDNTSTYLPTLKAFSAAGSLSGADASVTGIQAYRYDGIGSRNVDILFTLDALITQGFGNPDSRASAEVVAYFDNSGSFLTDFGTLIFESDATILDDDSVRLTETGTASSSVSFTVNSGESFYVAAKLRVSTERGGIADSENTFTASFTDSTGLTPVAVTAVPEPTSVTLIGFGIAVLSVRRRRG